ncbi:hypothetical protein VL04_09270 [Chromobacterium violaceum]|nr:hypothetical protein UF16_20580 [Chromobacterium violaceum]KMN48156.1 hypothetical protein VK93_17105 [Chromobacterium violaceum]KMN84505.1 hypothetical protein VL02_19100 [Chromobacterium violaceum]KMN90494.1 hypothetical protein VL04_09270 [Chromobacterium violaceum]KMO02539.1 hypothetical protein VL16_18125 [Chromobacterium violaceum]
MFICLSGKLRPWLGQAMEMALGAPQSDDEGVWQSHQWRRDGKRLSGNAEGRSERFGRECAARL